MNTATELPSQEELLKLFYYNNGLKWKVDNNKGGRNVKAGDDVVGWSNKKGYKQIMLGGKQYYLSRITYQIIHGNLTKELVIDHINRDSSDDLIENLRATTRKYNNRNRGIRSDNMTGVTGISLGSVRRLKQDGTSVEYQRYVAHWSLSDGKIAHKSFSIIKYGKENAFKLACEYRDKMLKSLKDSGEWYDENHGI